VLVGLLILWDVCNEGMYGSGRLRYRWNRIIMGNHVMKLPEASAGWISRDMTIRRHKPHQIMPKSDIARGTPRLDKASCLGAYPAER
jgi:hypothetical protein